MKKQVLLITVIILVLGTCLVAFLWHNEKKDTAQQAIIDKSGAEKALTSQGSIYINNNLGFRLVFPKKWEGNYIIDETVSDFIAICFVGKSKISKEGLCMFYIGNDESVKDGFIDSVRKLKSVNGKRFYYFTNTDYPVGALFDSPLVDDEQEKKLMEEDFSKAREMEQDIEGILLTLEPISL